MDSLVLLLNEVGGTAIRVLLHSATKMLLINLKQIINHNYLTILICFFPFSFLSRFYLKASHKQNKNSYVN